jgi:hypothetical protein
MKLESNRISLDRLATLCKVDTPQDFQDKLDSGYTYGYVYKQALENGKTESEAEQLAVDAESEEMGEACTKYHAALVDVSEHVFAEHGLVMTPIVPKKHPDCLPFEFRVMPKTTWKDALTKVRETVNGYGPFHFYTNKEMAESIPETDRGTVLCHLSWCFRAWEVYGDNSPKSRIERAMR